MKNSKIKSSIMRLLLLTGLMVFLSSCWATKKRIVAIQNTTSSTIECNTEMSTISASEDVDLLTIAVNTATANEITVTQDPILGSYVIKSDKPLQGMITVSTKKRKEHKEHTTMNAKTNHTNHVTSITTNEDFKPPELTTWQRIRLWFYDKIVWLIVVVLLVIAWRFKTYLKWTP